jgi:hypothetical protein
MEDPIIEIVDVSKSKLGITRPHGNMPYIAENKRKSITIANVLDI